MTFEALFADISYRYAPNSSRDVTELEIAEVITSPDKGAENAVFVALDTALRDGHARVGAAYAAGCRLFVVEREVSLPSDAVVLLCENTAKLLAELSARVYGYPERSLTVIGITGTHASGQCARMLERILREDGRRVARLSPTALYVDGDVISYGAIVPDAAEIRRALVRMVASGAEIAILEFTPYQLSYAASQGIPFLAVALSDLSPRETREGGLAGFEAYTDAIANLMAAEAAFALLPVGVDMMTAGRLLRHGENGDVRAENASVVRGENGIPSTRISLVVDTEETEITLPVIGDMSVNSATLSLALARILCVGVQRFEKIAPMLCAGASPECVYAANGRLIYVDNAYDGESLERVLRTLQPLSTGRLCVLLGAVGDRAEWRRTELGRVAERCADYVYLSADNPDREDPERICEDIRGAMEESERAVILASRKRAIRRAVRELRAGDVLLLAGKSGEQHQLVRGVRRPFSDRDMLQDALSLVTY